MVSGGWREFNLIPTLNDLVGLSLLHIVIPVMAVILFWGSNRHAQVKQVIVALIIGALATLWAQWCQVSATDGA